jgi:hypothetical protein
VHNSKLFDLFICIVTKANFGKHRNDRNEVKKKTVSNGPFECSNGCNTITSHFSTMELLDLPEDVQLEIISFCDAQDLDVLCEVSQEVAKLVSKGPVHVRGLSNSTIFCYATYCNYGPVFMPFVKTIDLTDFQGLTASAAELKEALDALRFETLRGPKHLILNSSWAFTLGFVQDFMARNPWASITTIDAKALFEVPMEVDSLEIHTKAFARSNVKPRKRLVLVDFATDEELFHSVALEKALQSSIEHFECIGVLHDALFPLFRLHKNRKIKCLILHAQSLLEWTHMEALQHGLPNLESFGIIRSNYLWNDFLTIDWSLWPNVRHLFLQENFMLQPLDRVELTEHTQQMFQQLETFKIHSMDYELIETMKSLRTLECSLPFRDLHSFYSTVGHLKHLDSLTLHIEYAHLRSFCLHMEETPEELEWIPSLKRLTLVLHSWLPKTFYTSWISMVRALAPNTMIDLVARTT